MIIRFIGHENKLLISRRKAKDLENNLSDPLIHYKYDGLIVIISSHGIMPQLYVQFNH